MKGLVYFERQSNWLEPPLPTNVESVAAPARQCQEIVYYFQQMIEKFPHSQYVGDCQAAHDYLRNAGLTSNCT